MSSQTDEPVAGSAQADETASWVTTAESFAAWATQAKAANLDFSWRSLGELDQLIERLAASKDPVNLKARLGLAAYVGEVLVRQFGGHWATGEHFGEVLPPEGAAAGKARPEPAKPTEMVERRLGEGAALQHQVYEQSRAWSVQNGVVGTTSSLDGPASMMRLAAETFVTAAVAGGATWLDYSPESVMRLDELIGEFWPPKPPKGTFESMIPAMGAYIGEVLVKQTGGHWIRDPKEGYGVELNGQVAFPMNKVTRRFELGPEHPIGQFYSEISSHWLSGNESPATGHLTKEKRGLFGRRH